MPDFPWEPLYEGVVLGFNAGIMPGPLLALMIAATVTQGFSAGLRVALVPIMTDLPIIALAGWVSMQHLTSDAVMGVFLLVGAVGVAYLAWQSFHHLPGAVHAQACSVTTVQTALVVNLFNPSPYLFWLGVGFPIVLKSAQSGWFSVVVFVVSFYCLLVGTKAVVAFLVHRVGYNRVSVVMTRLNVLVGGLLLTCSGWMLYDGWRFLSADGK